MATNAITENDEEELIPVETPIVEKPAEEDPKDEDEDDVEDSRLAESQDDTDDEVTASRKRRLQRRDVQKKARERSERELAMLREQNAMLLQRMSAVEQQAVGVNETTLRARLQESVNRVTMAEQIMARAAEAGNGDDIVAALRVRDEAKAEAEQLLQARQRLKTQAAPVGRVAEYAQSWVSQNPWYDPSGRDPDSALTKQIDSTLAAEGYDPNTRAYWEELTARVADALTSKTPAQKADEPANRQAPRKGPPVGDTREHAPTTTRKEIYVTPERKQAMIEAGAWDDPVKRKRYLKAYQDYDHGSART